VHSLSSTKQLRYLAFAALASQTSTTAAVRTSLAQDELVYGVQHCQYAGEGISLVCCRDPKMRLLQMANRDKDFRYMASSDLLTELGKDTFKIDGDAEKRLTTQLLKLLEDSSGDVQGIAVKCLGPFIKRVNEAQVGEICDQLATLLLKEKNDVRDIASLGLKLAIENANPRDGALVVKRLSQRLTTAVASVCTLEYCADFNLAYSDDAAF
jgi:hypothetical protein